MNLRDMEDIGLPVNLTPVWPEMDTKSVAQLIESAKKDVGKRMNGNEGRFLRAQLRALDYLYGNKDEAIDTKSKDNPLVDIIALIANIGDAKSASSTYQIAVEGTPKPIPLITKTSREKKPEQRTFEIAPWGRKEHRTIARFSNQISTVLRGLNLLTEASKHHPLIIRSTIHEYSNNFGGGTHFAAGTAVGLLEIINNLDLLNDARFHSLSSELREVVFEEVKSYKELKERYSYRVVDKRRFWYQGEVDTYARKKMNYVKVDGINRIEVNRFPKFSVPTITGWQRKSRERSKIIKEHRQLTLFNSIKRTAVNFSEDKAIQAVSDDRLKKADLTEQKRNLEQKQHGKLRRAWRKFVETEIDEGSNITRNEERLVKDAVNLILDYFVTDPALSQKAKANILGNKNSGDKNFYYQIDSKALAKDYLFSWILALRNPYTAKGFKEALKEGEHATESFYLLTKLMVFEILNKSLGTKEHKFLFDPNYKHKFDTETILALFDDIKKLGDSYVPDISDIVKEALKEGDSNIEDLLSESSIGKMKKSLEKLTYKTILGKLRKDKARAITESDKKRAKKISKWMLFLFGPMFIGIVGRKGLIEIKQLIDKRKEGILEAEIAEHEAKVREVVEAEAKRQAEMDRIRKIQAAAVSMVEGENQKNEKAGLAANMARIPGEMTERIPDAIRLDGEDNLPRENSERYGLTGFGKIYHIPEFMSLRDGQPIGYFPWDINLATVWADDMDTFHWYHPTRDLAMFENTHHVDSIDSSGIEFGPNQLAYSLNGVNAEVYPPVGWKIVKVYQEGGKTPMIGPLGELYYAYDNYDNFPVRTLLVLEETPREFVDPKIAILSETTVSSYWPNYHSRIVNEANSYLEGDERLQQIHADFGREMSDVYDGIRYYYYAEDIIEAKKEWSEIAIKYAKLYADYTVQERFYALGFQVDKSKENDYLTLGALADQPDEGYFCSVASFAFRDFMRSVGITTGNQPGITLFNSQGYLWGGLGHQNNVVFLPDGRVLEVDMTPYVTDKTPQEDLDWLTGRIVTEEEIKKAIDDMLDNTYGLNSPEGAPTPVSEEEMLAQIAQDNEIIRLIQNNKNYVSDSKLGTTLDSVSQSVREMITARVQGIKDPTTITDIESFEGYQHEITLLNKISTNARRVQDNSVSMKDIYLSNASGEQILQKYDFTEQVIRDAKLLQTILSTQNDDTQVNSEISTLNEIISDMEDLQSVLNNIGSESLEQARKDNILVSELAAEYRRFKELGGNSYKEKLDSYDLLSKPEIIRAERYKEENRMAEDIDLLVLEEELGRYRSEAIDYINIILTKLNDNPEDDTVGFDDEPWRINSETIRYSRIVRRRVNNTPAVLNKLDEKSKEVLENLPSTLKQMEEIFNGEHVDLEDEKETMRDISRDFLYLKDSLYKIYQEKELQGFYDTRESERLMSYTERYLAEREKQANDEKEEKETKAIDISGLGNVAKVLGASVIPLAIGYLGIHYADKRKSKGAILDKIQESLNVGGNLTRIEKDIVLSTIGHLTHLTYDDAFPEKAAVLLNLIQQYSPANHEDAVRWLTNEGADTLFRTSSKESFAYLAELTNGKARNTSAEEIRRYFPASVTEELDILSKKNGSNGKDADIEIPHDFGVIYGISQILFNDSLMSLQKEVRKRLEVEDLNSEISISYKLDDVLDLLRSKYASSHTSEKAKSIFNSILLLLNWNTVSNEDPIFTE